MAKCNDNEIIEHALQQFNEYIENGIKIAPNLRGVYYSIAGRQNSKKYIEHLQKIFKTVDFSEIKNNCIMGKFFPNQTLIK